MVPRILIGQITLQFIRFFSTARSFSSSKKTYRCNWSNRCLSVRGVSLLFLQSDHATGSAPCFPECPSAHGLLRRLCPDHGFRWRCNQLHLQNSIVLTGQHNKYSHGSGKIERLKDARGWRKVDVVLEAQQIIEMIRSERLRLGMPTDGYIFCVDDRLQSFYSSLGKMINKYCDEIGIPRRSLHSTRRTCASLMHASDEISDLTIQNQLGHKDLRTTQNSYCYDLSEDNERYESISRALGLN